LRVARLDGEAHDSLIWPLRLADTSLAALLCIDAPPNFDPAAPFPEDKLAYFAALFTATLESAGLRSALEQTKDQLTQQVEELTILQSVDEELNGTLNLENVMMLATDWALRRTGARTVILAVANPDGLTLDPLVMLGYPRGKEPYGPERPIPVAEGIIGRAAETNQLTLVNDVRSDRDYVPTLPGMRAQIAVPLLSQGNLLGVLSLESDRPEGFGPTDVEFIKRLSARAAGALDNARLYRQAEKRADEASALYTAGRAISSTLEREEILPRIAQSLTLVMGGSGALVTDLRSDRITAGITATYDVPHTGAHVTLPPVGTLLDLTLTPALLEATRNHHSLALQLNNPEVGALERQLLREWHSQAALITPLIVGEEVLGLAAVTESRNARVFSDEEILLFETLVAQAAVALRQARLYENLRELENLKSEMIRMASHDLRNPLGNIMGFIEILTLSLGSRLDEEEREALVYMKRSATTMKSLIDDLLTLEKIESERSHSWTVVDFGQLVYDVYDSQKATAELKHHTLLLEYSGEPILILGSSTQIRQAAVNLIGNALKYTAPEGRIQIRLFTAANRIQFEVEDNGYGISAERQKRLFQRFYRAKQPGTEEIPGTGLGLSMVKTIVERHGGEVWVQSQENVGSTFGFWLPTADTMIDLMGRPPVDLEEV
jgi:signal transduction histidine kinase